MSSRKEISKNSVTDLTNPKRVKKTKQVRKKKVMINQGSGGRLYRLKGTNIAMKRIEKDKIIILELAILLDLNHPNVCTSFGYELSNRYLDIYLPLAVSDTFVTIPHELYDSWKEQLISALYYLHQNDIIHGDVKPSNVLYYPEENKIMLTDFGYSVIYKNYKSYTQRVCSPKYRPIETTARGVKFYGGWKKSVDVWALGCTLYYWKNGENLIPNQNSSDYENVSWGRKHTNTLLNFGVRTGNVLPFPYYKISYTPCFSCDTGDLSELLQFIPQNRIKMKHLIKRKEKIKNVRFRIDPLLREDNL